MAMCSRRERISSRPAEFQTLHSAWQAACCQAVLPVQNASQRARVSFTQTILCHGLVCRAACYRTDHLRSAEGRHPTGSLLALCLRPQANQPTKVWARFRSSSVFVGLGSVVPPGSCRPAPRGFLTGSRFMPNQFRVDSWAHPHPLF